MIKVSVWVTTYNHENYIAQALESALMQETDFEFEIIVGEDCSTDKTREIVLSYKEKYPEKIILCVPEKNLGMIEMNRTTYKMCSGKYIAWLDGDDYWTDPHKLQKQVNFMDEHEDIVMCYHKSMILKEVTGKSTYSRDPVVDNNENIISLKDLMEKFYPVTTPSVLFRNILPKDLPEWFYTLPYLDRAYFYLLLQHGNAKYMSEAMSVYRDHKRGAWTGLNEIKKFNDHIKFHSIFKKHFNKEYSSILKKTLRKWARKKIRYGLRKRNVFQSVNGLRVLVTNAI
jgi:glycosyltransferase involved in cell wall biosynthesis